MTGIPLISEYTVPGPTELPRNLAPWQIEPRRAALLIHDMQRYFVRSLPQQPRATVLQRCAGLRAHAAGAGIPIIYSAQPGNMTDAQRGLLRDFWGPGMRGTPEDRQVVPELTPDPTDHTITKWRYSAFVGSGLLDLLRNQGRDQLVVCGIYAHVGVLATALDAFANDIETFLVADAVADFSRSRHRMALAYAAERCAVVLSASGVVADLEAADPVAARRDLAS